MRGEAAKRATGACSGSGSRPSPCSSASPPPARPLPLNAAVCRADRVEPRERVAEVHRQRDEDERDAVAHRRLLAGAAARDGHHHLQRRRRDAPQQREPAQRAGDHRERDVVERGAAGALDLEQLADRERVAGERAAGPDRVVEERRRRRPRDVLADGHRGPAQRAAEAGRRSRRPRGAAERPQGLGAGVHERVDREPRRARARPRRFSLLRRGRLGRVRVEVEQQQRDRQRGLAVDERVMDLHHEAGRPVLEARREVDLPQRLRAVQRAREHRVGERVEAGARERLVVARERDDVAAQVEALRVDPHGMGESARRERESPAEARRGAEPGGDLRPHARQRDRRPRRIGAEAPLPRHVHVRARGLRVQEGGVERGQAVSHDGACWRARPRAHMARRSENAPAGFALRASQQPAAAARAARRCRTARRCGVRWRREPGRTTRVRSRLSSPMRASESAVWGCMGGILAVTGYNCK